jgi:predicted PurR-regulated permease PerM
MLIEPFLLVDPLQVFGEVVTNFFMSPFSVIGVHLNKFFNDFFIDTPIFLTAVKLIFMVLTLFYLSGYRITSWFVTIEPSQRPERVERIEPGQFHRQNNSIEPNRDIDHTDNIERPSRALQRFGHIPRVRASSIW